MRTAAVVMCRPLAKRAAEVPFVNRDHAIQAFTTHAPNQPFAMRIRGRGSHGRTQHFHTQVLKLVIQFSRETALPIVQDEAIAVIAWKCLSQLLERPLGGGVLGDVEVEDASRSDLHRYKYIKDTETSRNRNNEVAGHNSVGMVAHECGPTLIP